MTSKCLKSCTLPITHHALLIFALLVGCAVPHTPSRLIYEDPTSFVRLEPDHFVLPEWLPSHHSHPFSIGPDEMAGFLKRFLVREHRIRLQVMFSGEAPREPVFRDGEIGALAPRLSEALAQAKPDELVTFYVSHPQTSIKREITSGGVYVMGYELHFILGNWRIIYGIPAYGMIYDRRYPMRPTAAKGFDLFFDPADAVVKQYTGVWDRLLGRAKDEMVIDLRKVPTQPPATKTARVSSSYRMMTFPVLLQYQKIEKFG
jgi:hypothetical protein